MAGTHSIWSPSGWDRKLICPASYRAELNQPDRTGLDAETGTVGHSVLDRCTNLWLRGKNDDPYQFLGEMHQADVNGVSHDIEVDEEMCDAVQFTLDKYKEAPGDHYPEHKVEVTPWTPIEVTEDGVYDAQFGTSDHAACDTELLTIDDFKYGKNPNNKIYATRNPQLAGYALGVYRKYFKRYRFKRVRISIIQPRLDHHDVWELSVSELLAFGAEIKAGLKKCLEPNPAYNPEPAACTFCKARKNCAPLAEKIARSSVLKFDDLSGEFEPEPGKLTLADLAEAYSTKKLYDIRFNAVLEELERRMLAGQKPPGLKLVAGTSHRRFVSEAKATFCMATAGIPTHKQHTKKLITPRQAEILAGPDMKKYLQEAIIKPPGAPAIVPESDPRPAYGQKHVDVFDDYDDLESEL